ncbi:MAG: D-alanyl-D-alanine carboxypeptidase, partial [Actinomycetota bacterium]
MGARAVTVGVLLVAVVGYGVADSLDVAPGVLTVAPAPTRPIPTPRPTPSEPAHLAPAAVLGELSDQAQEPTPAGVRAALAPLLAAPALGSRVSAYVADARSGEVLSSVAAERPMVPASVTKLLTAAAVLSTVGGPTRVP